MFVTFIQKNLFVLLRDAKEAGINVTAEVCPHHLLFEEMDIPSDDANWKMNPPLRAKDDKDSLLRRIIRWND